MAKETKITCDNCENDLTNTGKMPKFRLRLVAETLPHVGNSVYAVMIHPPIKEDKYFCDLNCLKDWLLVDE